MSSAIKDILQALGWGDGLRIPISNAENKCLEDEIASKTRRIASLKSRLQNVEERISDIQRHTLDIRQQHAQNQKLLTAHSAQVEVENQLCSESRSTKSKYNQETRQNTKEAEELTRKIQILDQTLKKLTQKVEVKKQNVQAIKERLYSWEEKLNKKDEDNFIIEQIVKSDEKTFNKTELERQKLRQSVEELRQGVCKVLNDIQELEIALDKTARFYGQTIKDRRTLMNQWSQSVDVLKQRDKAIYKALEEINTLRLYAKERREIYEETERFLSIQVAENKETEFKTRQREKQLAHLKEEKQKFTDTIDSYTVEFHVQQKTLQDLARKIQDLRVSLKRKKLEEQNKRALLDDYVEKIKELTATLKKVNGQKLNAEEQTKQMEDMLDKEVRRQENYLRDIRRFENLILRSNRQLDDLERERKAILNQQENEMKEFDHLVLLQSAKNKLLKERKEFLNQVDLEVQKCEVKLRSLSGQDLDKEEVDRKNKRLAMLQSSLKEKMETAKIMQAQVAEVDHDIKKASTLLSSGSEELVLLENKKQELTLLLDGGEKHLRAYQNKYQEKLVDMNILMLKVAQLEESSIKKENNLYDLEKHAIQMEAAMQERQAEINVQKERLNMEKKVILSDVSELRQNVVERKTRIQQLQIRYENIVAALGDNPNGENPLDLTYLKVQSAQERYLLQERGDKLDKLNQKAEFELREMEKALIIVQACNDKCKSTLSSADDGNVERLEQIKLEEEIYNEAKKLKQKKQILDKHIGDLQQIKDEFEQVQKKISKIEDEKSTKEQLLHSLEQQVNEQNEKIARADRCLKKVVKSLQTFCMNNPDVSMELPEKDIAVKELREQNLLALHRITEFTIRHVEAEAYVKKLLEEKNISLPSVSYLEKSPSISRCESLVGSRRKSTNRLRTFSPGRSLSSSCCTGFTSGKSSTSRAGSSKNSYRSRKKS